MKHPHQSRLVTPVATLASEWPADLPWIPRTAASRTATDCSRRWRRTEGADALARLPSRTARATVVAVLAIPPLDERAPAPRSPTALPDDAGRAVVKLIVTRGSGGRGYRPPEPSQPTRILAISDLARAYPRATTLRASRVRVCATAARREPAARRAQAPQPARASARASWSCAAATSTKGLMLGRAVTSSAARAATCSRSRARGSRDAGADALRHHRRHAARRPGDARAIVGSVRRAEPRARGLRARRRAVRYERADRHLAASPDSTSGAIRPAPSLRAADAPAWDCAMRKRLRVAALPRCVAVPARGGGRRGALAWRTLDAPLTIPARGRVARSDERRRRCARHRRATRASADCSRIRGCSLRTLAERGDATRVRAGEYRVAAGTTPLALLQKLVAGRCATCIR